MAYEIGPFRLDVDAKVLTRAGIATGLGPRAVSVLAALVERPNEYVPKARILDTAWPGLVVEEANLAVQMSAIRRVLAEAPGGAGWIETLARRGYRFTGPVTRVAEPDGRVAGSARTNLPEAVTSFIGRERELVEIKRLLSTTRLLTVTGVGGIGKTRLVQQAASEILDAYRDGVWFVDLAPLSHGGLVASAVGQVLGTDDGGVSPAPELLAERMRDRELLLVLDNCEHLLDACAALAGSVLRRAAGTTILATSREPLVIDGEQIYTLSPLALPDPAAAPAAIAAAESALLFVDRARRRRPDFVLADAQAPALAELCRRLDGIPLALELAAARVPALSIAELNARLTDRFRLLTGGARDALPRHQTLRGTLDWSYGLLPDAERIAWRRLAVFPGAFGLEGSASVVPDDRIDEASIVDVVAHLVAHSLVVVEARDGGARYRLLETTRAYGLEMLAASGETALLRRRHARFVCARFEPALGDWWRMPEPEWIARYATDRDDVRAALDWAFQDGGDPALGVALAGASGPIWTSLSLIGEGTAQLGEAVRRIDPATPAAHQARLWLWWGIVQQDHSPGEATAALERAHALYLHIGDAFGAADAQLRRALALARLGRCDDARLAVAAADPELRRADLAKAKGVRAATLGVIAMMAGDPGEACRQYEEARVHYRAARFDYVGRGIVGNLADAYWALQDLAAAEATFLEYLALLQSQPHARRVSLGFALCNLAGVLTERGEIDRALAAAREGLPLLRDSDRVWTFADHVALATALAGRTTAAARIAGYADAARARKQAPREPNEIRARARLAALLAERLEPDECERLLADGATLTADDVCRLALED